MGKGQKGGRGGTKYVHNHTYNPVARESDERKIERLHNMEVKRYQNCVDRNMKVITQYLPLDAIAYKKKKVDPMYFLKGAARPAQEFYRPPGYQEDVEPVDLTVTYKGRLWEHEAEECKELLRSMSELSSAMHNVKGKTKDAIGVLKQMIELDNADHMFARHKLLRCYLDSSEAGEARALLDKYPEEPYCCFVYSKALIECIALLLEEADASVHLIDQALTKAYEANPYGLWTIALHEFFSQSVEHADRIKDDQATPHSVMDALRFFDVDVPLWIETDGAVQHVKDYIVHYKLTPPSASSSSAVHGDGLDSDEEEAEEEEKEEDEKGGDADVLVSDEKNRTGGEKDKKRKSVSEDQEDNESEEGDGEEDEDGGGAVSEEENGDFEMFAGMFDTAIEMAAEEDSK